MRGRKADGNEKVDAVTALGDDRPVIYRIGPAFDALFDVALVADAAVGRHVAPHVVRIHRVGGVGDRSSGHALPDAVVFGHHVVAHHPARLAHIKLTLPAVAEAVLELIPARSPARREVAHRLRHPRMVSQRPEKPLLVFEMRGDDFFSFGVRRLGIVPVRADEIERSTLVVVGVGLAVGQRTVPHDMPVLARLEIAQQQFVIALVVA